MKELTDTGAGLDSLRAVAQDIAALAPELSSIRHELHQIPEVGLHLPKTAARVRQEIDALGLEVHECQSATGFMVVLRGGAGTASPRRPIVLLRADMDALPVQEDTGLDWASRNGNMHACGHDLHTAGLIGAMRVLTARREELAGDVVFMFQSGEEGWHGAQHMINEGMLDVAGRTPDHAYGVHVWSSRYPAGFIGTRPGPMMASSDSMAITIHGHGGHGSAPHETRDPIPVAASIVTEAQVMVAREFNIFDPVVATCGQIHAGTIANVIPNTAFLEFTLRTLSAESRSRLIRRLRELSENTAAAHGMRAECKLVELYPVTNNDPHEYEFAAQTISSLYPERWQLQRDPMAAAEDFSQVLERIPGVFIGVSAVNPGEDHTSLPFNHSPHARFRDDAIADAATILATLAYRRLAGGADPGVSPSTKG